MNKLTPTLQSESPTESSGLRMLAAKKTSWALERPKRFAKLTKNLEADVVIVGAGLAGLLCAYELTKRGKKVVVLEKKKVAAGATHYTTAFITQYIDTDQTELISLFGQDKARVIWESHGKAVDYLEEIINSEKISCEFSRCPAFVYTRSEKENKYLLDEQRILRQWNVNSLFATNTELGFRNNGALIVPNQAKFHPLKFLFGLAKTLEKMGVLIFEDSEVIKISSGKQTKASTATNFDVANDVIVATYLPFNNPKNTHYKKGMYVSYVLEAKLKKGKLQEGLYWDLANPYNYFRVDAKKGYDRMILGGADHRAELPISEKVSFNALKQYLSELFGKDIKSTKQWSGPILEPSDGIALIGEYKPHQYVASAFSGNGMTYSAISAILLSDLIYKKQNAWADVYDPKRKLTAKQIIKKGMDYTQEFFGGAVKNLIRQKSRS